MANRPANHPVNVSGIFQASADSELNVVRGNQYGLVTTGSFFQCAGVSKDKEFDFEVHLLANTAITNSLEEGIFYSLSGRMIAQNDGTAPVITYFPDEVLRIGPASEPVMDLTNKASVVGLGYVEERNEVETNGGDGEPHLEVIVGHNDWDSHNRCHKGFKIIYVVPGSKNMVKTHALYAVGREMQIVGHLVDWDIERQMAVVLVKAVSLANGHQNPRTVSKASPSGSTPGKNGRTFYKFGTKPITPVTPGASVRNNIEVESPLKGKGKARDPDDSPVTEESIEAQVDIESVTEGPSKKGRGRPRLDESEGASKKQKDK
ncbi:hypothetical protein PSTG_10114 [Puccinia striiformis f. sp. tritici PST-78]|uniref:Uncharacterized protein n=1 Tax=Puccinia striiformis f. sp. tritici PST-78 TaxID=1165861 RepID=A0A0L0VBA3_9BASI|nr:hypothetical protein PSTG_10114 [Puccinia striiformis f. sp. tritici PST-78]